MRRWRSGQSHPAISGAALYMWYVYILKSKKDNKYYIGCTSDLDKRLVRHNKGGNKSTKNRKPLELIHRELYDDKHQALARERKIKSYKGGDEFKRLISGVGGGVDNRTRL